MNNQLIESIPVDAQHFGLTEERVSEIRTAFDVSAQKFIELQNDFDQVTSEEQINLRLCARAAALRKKYVKVRTGADGIHKEVKKDLLAQTKVIDYIRRFIREAAQEKENALLDIEQYFARMEAERKAKLREKRTEELQQYGWNGWTEETDLSNMSEEVWTRFLAGQKQAYQEQIEEAKREEAERIARKKALAEERERIRKENERLRAEAAKREKEEAERRKKEQEARKVAEEKARKEREAVEAKLAKERAEREKIAAELAKKQQEEKARIAAIEEQKRRARLAPDKEKLMAFASKIDALEVPEVESQEADRIATEARRRLGFLSNYIKEVSKSL